jgi:hypothetical protein
MSDTNNPAFPSPIGLQGYGTSRPVLLPDGSTGWEEYSTGMTLRDYFAAKALNGMLSCEKLASDAAQAGIKPAQYASGLATASYLFADAMIAARG